MVRGPPVVTAGTGDQGWDLSGCTWTESPGPGCGAGSGRWCSRVLTTLHEEDFVILALEAGFFGVIGRGLGAIVLYALVGLVLMLLGFYAIDLTTPGKLNRMVRAGQPNAVAITAAGMVSMAFIVVVAIYGSSGRLAEGLLASLIFGLFGIVVQVFAVRVLEWVMGIDIGACLNADELRPQVLVVGAAHVALGLVVAVAIL